MMAGEQHEAASPPEGQLWYATIDEGDRPGVREAMSRLQDALDAWVEVALAAHGKGHASQVLVISDILLAVNCAVVISDVELLKRMECASRPPKKIP